MKFFPAFTCILKAFATPKAQRSALKAQRSFALITQS
jgi:hypothetical protein